MVYSPAIRQNDLKLVQWFLSHGANVNLRQTAYTSDTPLTYAVRFASVDIVKLLVTHGSKVTRGYPLHAVAESSLPGRLEVLRFLLDHGARMDELQLAGNRRRFKLLSRIGLGTPLHAAVKEKKITVASILLDCGADRDIVDTKGQTPLDLAKERQLPRFIELLER